MSGYQQLREIRSWRWPKVTSAALFCALFGSGTLIRPAAAFELFGERYFEDPADAEPLSPDAQPYDISVDILGVPEDVSERLKAASQLYLEREDRPPPSGAALLSRVRGEYARLLGALYGEGFYGGAVDILVDGRDPSMIAPDAVLPKPVRVTISVDPGPVFSFGDVAISGRAPPPANADDVVDKTLDDLGLSTGKVARSTAVLTGERLLIEEWRQQGYPKASIANREATADHPSRLLNVAITASSGPSARYGVVEASGTTAMDKEFTAWMTGLEPGVTYDPDDIRRAEANLRRLEVFSSQKIVEGDQVSPDGTLPLTVGSFRTSAPRHRRRRHLVDAGRRRHRGLLAASQSLWQGRALAPGRRDLGHQRHRRPGFFLSPWRDLPETRRLHAFHRFQRQPFRRARGFMTPTPNSPSQPLPALLIASASSCPARSASMSRCRGSRTASAPAISSSLRCRQKSPMTSAMTSWSPLKASRPI